MIKKRENILLSDYTTIKLGGKAKYFIKCDSEEEIIEAVRFANEENMKIQVLGGGSNIIFSDDGFNGIVLKVEIKGITIQDGDKEKIILKTGAGENWDEFVKFCVEKNYTGIECLAGIPGSIGATPIQNVGAYGQEVKDTIQSVKVIDKKTFETKIFSNKDCRFGYRESRYKNIDKDKYIITEISFELIKNGIPEIKYPELQNYIEEKYDKKTFTVKDVYESVLELRKKKSMVLDEKDPNTISCGSFFVNPIITIERLENLKIQNSSIPFYQTENGIKVSAAWLIENAGFPKGYIKNGAGISENHSLALINRGGTTTDLLKLANEIKDKVFEKFKIKLESEPEIIKN